MNRESISLSPIFVLFSFFFAHPLLDLEKPKLWSAKNVACFIQTYKMDFMLWMTSYSASGLFWIVELILTDIGIFSVIFPGHSDRVLIQD